MTTYIHYTQRAETGLLVSGNTNEAGYTLGLVIECDCFRDVLNLMSFAQDGKAVHATLQNNIVDNMNLSVFKNAFMRSMDTFKQFSRKNYRLWVINDDGTMSEHTRMIVPRLH